MNLRILGLASSQDRHYRNSYH
ncbi:BgTH12-02882 [Blumeria graminis f. sp. triticale]|uniref:BgTH12-02882 n=1 Tax=Blumeria graminis f. sp. triticale TaxID=1689686 RepID=A0A9W4GF49_BLUGR|nr:BgTH12-02882 [Blumeria graminis f. sp. triticale]